MDKGVIYVARGADYLDLARASAESLRAVEPAIAIDLFTDQPDPGGPFDVARPIPDSGTRDKIACMRDSRFECTLFLDCDTLVLRPLGDLWGLLDRFDLALCHDVRRSSALIRRGWRIDTPYAFPQMNSGVMLYRRSSAMLALLKDWADAYLAAGASRDQVTLRDLLWSSDLRFYVLPPEFNLRRITELDAWEPLDARPTILHSHRLLQHLRCGGGRVTSLPDLLTLERAALAEEWAALGLPPRAADGEDPLPRFLLAERHAGD
jgi:hypothetical protein